MINSNNTTLLNVKLNSTEKKITNIEDVNCIMSVSYRIKDDKVMLWFQTSCKEGNKVIFEMECEYKCPIEEYDDEKEICCSGLVCGLPAVCCRLRPAERKHSVFGIQRFLLGGFFGFRKSGNGCGGLSVWYQRDLCGTVPGDGKE